jgi:hypothetical protein
MSSKRSPISLRGIRRWNRENGCAPFGGEEGNVAEGEQAAERYHHREGIHSPPIENSSRKFPEQKA